ncbi:putative Pollike protein, partial [Globisporangium splendens]
MENKPTQPTVPKPSTVAPASISGFTPSTSTGTTVDPSPSENLDPADPRPSENVFALLATDPVSCDHSPVTDPAVGTSTDSEEKVDETMDPAVHASGSNDDGSGDVPMLPPSADSTGAGSHAGNSVPTPPAPSSPATDTRLSMADILRLQEDIRRDRAVVDASRRRVETPKPLAVDIEAIERQYAAGGDWSNIASRLEQARPYQLPRAKYDMVIETGRALAKTPVQKILASLASSGHGNAALEELYKRFEIGQISKLPGGNLRVKVKSKDACVRLERTKVNILGGVFTFKEFDILGDKYYLDISNVDSDTNTDLILERLFILGCKPVYDTFREVNLATGVTSATWRVYFLSSSCPCALIINSGVCDQVIFDNKLHPAHGKNAPFRSERLPFGYRSTQALELGVPGGVFPFPGSLSEPALRSQKPNQHGSAKSYAQAAAATPKQPSPPSATKGQRAWRFSATSEELSMARFWYQLCRDNLAVLPRVIRGRLFSDQRRNDGPTVTKKEHTRSDEEERRRLRNMVAKQQPQTLTESRTPTTVDVLQSVEWLAKREGNPSEPEALKESKESAFFIEKHHTKVRKSPKASHIVEVAESMANDENTALLSVLPDRLTHADTKVDAACKIVANATNADHVTKHAVENPLAFNSALSLKMAGTGHEMQELAQLHMINRVLSASDPSEDTTFSTKWKKFMKTKVPSTRGDLFHTAAKWWTTSEPVRELSRATKALSLFELMLMSIAPTIFANDHWIQYLTGMPVPWIPAHHTRLLHPNTLLMLLRSELGALCMKQWAEVQWQGRILEDLEALRDLEDYYPDDAWIDPSSGRSGGVLTVLRSDVPGFETAAEQPSLAVPGRYLVVKVMVSDAPVYIHNVYAPVDRQEKQQFFSSLSTEDFEDQATHLVLGDLNTPLDPRLDSSSPDLCYEPARSSCLAWLARLGVVDAWRVHHDTRRVFTGPLPRKNRLDYILLSEAFYERFYDDSKYFVPQNAGDHLAHLVVSAIEKEAETVRDQLRGSTNPGQIWERWKARIKTQLQDVQKKLCMQDTTAVEEARASLDQAAARYRESSTENNRSQFDDAMKIYKETVTRTSQYNQDNAFDFQAANSEKSTKHFFRPLDASLRKVSIEEVVTPSGSVSSNPQEISLHFLEHWGSEMGDPDSPAGTAPPPDEAKQQTLIDSIIRVLSELDREILNAPVTASDLADSIRHMKASSAPGMDGLTAGFYQVAPDVFGECLSIVFNDQLRRGILLPSQRKSAVVLLYKKGSRAEPGNYRPITLMPVDVKALSKTLTFRLQSVVCSLIHTDQKAFVKGRSIHHHVRFLADLQDLITNLDDEAYAMFLDFEKAFDRVNWDYMFRVLEKMGCGSAFIQWVRLLYTRPQAHLLINQNIQPALHPTRGVKQGDPLSALLFLLAIEPLGNLLRSHEEYGVCLDADHTATSMFFADDTTLLGGSIPSVQAQLELVDVYCKGSGAKLNLSKSMLMALNRNQDCPRLPGVQVLGRAESVKFLGIPFSQSPVNDAIVSFLDDRFYDGFKAWYRRARTLRGRLLVAQTMVLCNGPQPAIT